MGDPDAGGGGGGGGGCGRLSGTRRLSTLWKEREAAAALAAAHGDTMQCWVRYFIVDGATALAQSGPVTRRAQAGPCLRWSTTPRRGARPLWTLSCAT